MCIRDSLKLSSRKTQMVLFRGSLDRRAPLIRLQDRNLRLESTIRYLGVRMGRNFSIAQHVSYIDARGSLLFTTFGRLAKSTWGLRFPVLRLYYKSIFLAMATYAAGAWGDKVDSHGVRSLNSAQRQVLLRVTKAYRTTSTVGLQVLAGVRALDIDTTSTNEDTDNLPI